MKAAARITLRYTFVSALAAVVNVATQASVVFLYGGAFAIQLSVLLGTAAGLPVKYVLEKLHVFEFQSDSLAHDTRLFIFYGFMGVLTTLIFWGVEWAFHMLFQTDAMRYLGGLIGFTLGSFIKYHLDKRFVFKQVVA